MRLENLIAEIQEEMYKKITDKLYGIGAGAGGTATPTLVMPNELRTLLA